MVVTGQTKASLDVRAKLLGSTALALGLCVTPAFAQDADRVPPAGVVSTGDPNDTEDPDVSDVGEVDTIVVQGIRQAAEAAADLKRNADTVVDSLVASDVSSLPDLSVAEALQRVPGVTVSRFATGRASGGAVGSDFPSPEGSGNLIRGLSFVRSEFNGRDSFTANGGRALDFATVPPELIGAVDVFKNQSADLIEGGIGGTINLRTLEPFDRDGLTAVVTGDMTYTDLREEWAPQYSAILGNRWDTGGGEFGLLVSVSGSELKSLINGYQIGQANPREAGANGVPLDAFIGDVRPTDGEFVALRPAFQLRTNEVDRDRSSYYGAAQYRNEDRTFEVTAKVARVENEFDAIERTVEWFPDANTFNQVTVSDITLTPFSSDALPLCNGANQGEPGFCEATFPVTGGLMESGFVTDSSQSWFGAYGIELSNLGVGKRQSSETDDYSLNFKFRPADLWFVELDGQFVQSESSSDQLWLGSNGFFTAFTEPDLENPRLTFGVDDRLDINPFFIDGDNATYQRPTGTADPNGYHHQFAADQFQDGTGELRSFRADVQRDFDSDGWFESIKVGGRYVEREQTNAVNELNWAGIGPVWNNVGDGGMDRWVGYDTVEYDVISFTDFYRGGVLQGANTGFVFASAENLANPFRYFDFLRTEEDTQDALFQPRYTRNGDGSYTRNYAPAEISDIQEETFNAYARMDFYRDLDNGMSLDGNFGVRYVKTDLASNGSLQFVPFQEDIQSDAFQDDGNGNLVRVRTDDAETRDSVQDFLPETVAFVGQETADGLRAPADNNFDTSYEFWLPSFNMKWNLNEEMLVRFGVSKAMTRPAVQDLRAGQFVRANTARVEFPELDPSDPEFGLDRGVEDIRLTNITITGGNPDLKPTEAWNYDVTYEWYFGESNYFTTAVFYKDLENVIQYGSEARDTITLDGQTVGVNYLGQINLDEVSLLGTEIAGQYFFDEAPGLLSNFGIQANYTYINADATPPPDAVDTDGDGIPEAGAFEQNFRYEEDSLIGSSDHTVNLIGIYQTDKVEARLAYNWRSEYLVNYREFITGNPVFVDEAGFLDASLKLDVTDNIQLRFLAANLLDTKNMSSIRADQEGQRLPRSSFINDRRLQVGVKVEF